MKPSKGFKIAQIKLDSTQSLVCCIFDSLELQEEIVNNMFFPVKLLNIVLNNKQLIVSFHIWHPK